MQDWLLVWRNVTVTANKVKKLKAAIYAKDSSHIRYKMSGNHTNQCFATWPRMTGRWLKMHTSSCHQTAVKNDQKRNHSHVKNGWCHFKMSQIAFCCSTHPLQTLTEVIGLWGLANVCQSVWVECICSGIEHTSACQCTPRQSQRFTPTASGLHEVNIWMGGRAVGLARSSTLKCSVWPNKKQNGLEFWMRHNMWGFRTALTYFQLFIVSYS